MTTIDVDKAYAEMTKELINKLPDIKDDTALLTELMVHLNDVMSDYPIVGEEDAFRSLGIMYIIDTARIRIGGARDVTLCSQSAKARLCDKVSAAVKK